MLEILHLSFLLLLLLLESLWLALLCVKRAKTRRSCCHIQWLKSCSPFHPHLYMSHVAATVYIYYIYKLYCCVCVCVYCIPNPGIHSWYYLTECFCVCFSSFSSLCTIFIASSYYYSSPTFIHPLSPTTQTHLIKNIYACQDAAPSPAEIKRREKKVFRFFTTSVGIFFFFKWIEREMPPPPSFFDFFLPW